MFAYMLLTNSFLGFGMLGLTFEINSTFMHGRWLLNSYKLSSALTGTLFFWLDFVTQLAFRHLTFGWGIWLAIGHLKDSFFSFVMFGTICSSVIEIMNINLTLSWINELLTKYRITPEIVKSM